MFSHGVLLFCLAYFVATSTPGPGIAALLARVLARGTRGLPFFIAGFVIGDLIWFTLAATGMAVLAQTARVAFVVLRYAGALYLLYLAYRLWNSPVRPLSDEPGLPAEVGAGRSLASSLALTLGNPKVIVFYLALLPTVIDIRDMTLGTFGEVALAICLILSGVLTLYALAGLRARRLFRDVRAVRWLNRGSGTVMAGAAVAIASQ